ncbi:ATP synthase E chain-domain-containing protein [Schizophyllum amplum]|uniref:ATP synthase F(0) complex subunit e, mitochondrial n=1 Tax=Schizophyllum amplum TaxID=97359 RepID=A0A550D052_9AGAR|nr:ATP synthase E chain-domain-containing protein [Auriculariopsis ampla]
MASNTVNVVRYSALFSGVLYGWYHNRTVQREFKEQELQHAVHKREHLVEQAKAEWTRRQSAGKDSSESPRLVTDPEDPRFDLEKLFAKWEKDAA